VPLTDIQKKVVDSQARFRIVIAGRRSGKSYLSIRELIKHASPIEQICWFVSPTYKMSKTIGFEPTKKRLIELNWVKYINETELKIVLKNDSIIEFKGAEKFDNLRGRKVHFLVMDEFAFIDERAWAEVLRPVISDTLGKVLFCSTPQGFGNWSRDMYVRGLNEDNWASFRFTTLEGGQVPESEITQAKEDLDERTFRQEYEASFETFAGAIYYNFDREESVKKIELKEMPIGIGMDFNIEPFCAVCFQLIGEQIHIFDEIILYSSNTDEMVQEIKNRYKYPIVVFPDPAGNQRKTSAGGRTDISILQNAGFKIKVRHAHPAVRDRINAVNSRLKNSQGKRNIFIDPKCKNLITALEKHQYKKGTSVPDKDGYDHITDALGYAVEMLFPIRKEQDYSQPMRWS